MPEYFIRTDGDDSKPGRSDTDAWRTLGRVHSGTFFPGDKIRLKCNGLWREKLIPPSAGTVAQPIMFTAYGTGRLPVISGADIFTGWTRYQASDFWYRDCPWPAGVVFENGQPMNFCPWNNSVTASLSGTSAPAFTFNDSARRMYILCSGNQDPNSLIIEISSRDYCIDGNGIQALEFDNLVLLGAYRHGMVAGGASYYALTDVELKWHGGTRENGTYLGNGIEITPPGSQWKLTRVIAHDNFDVGISVQNSGMPNPISNIVMDYCECYRNRASGFEILEGSGSGDIFGITLNNCVGRNNDGLGWAGKHPNGAGLYIDNYGTGRIYQIVANDSSFFGNQRGINNLTTADILQLNRCQSFNNLYPNNGANMATHSIDVILRVLELADFVMGATPADLSVQRTKTGTYSVTATAVGGFATAITLSVSGVPTNASFSFSKNPILPGETSVFSITPAANTPLGNFTLSFTGNG